MMGVMMNFEGGWPHEPELLGCPRCGQDELPEDIHKCAYCETVGCEECMVGTIDGWCCSAECAEKLKTEQDEIDREWDEKLKKLKTMNGGER